MILLGPRCQEHAFPLRRNVLVISSPPQHNCSCSHPLAFNQDPTELIRNQPLPCPPEPSKILPPVYGTYCKSSVSSPPIRPMTPWCHSSETRFALSPVFHWAPVGSLPLPHLLLTPPKPATLFLSYDKEMTCKGTLYLLFDKTARPSEPFPVPSFPPPLLPQL